jgi:hypothetical protein
LPLDPKLSELCDEGRIEDYTPEGFDGVVDFIVKIVDHMEKLKAKEAEAQAH